MKTILLAISLALSSFTVTAGEPAKTKEVCKVGKDNKKTCKTVKVHKKLEGKKVPQK